MFKYLLLTLLVAASAVVADGEQGPSCLMEPTHRAMQVPEEGLVWLEGEELHGACDAVLAKKWVRRPSKTFDLLVYADGPSGSGRFWNVTVGVVRKQDTHPSRGFCLTTSTVGWLTLRHFKKLPLPWIEDQDGDGSPELIIWDSFPLSEEASLAEDGLVAWVYQVDPNGRFTLDWSLSRTMAGELAAAYRNPPELSIRARGAEALEAFANGACTMRGERAR